MSLCGLGQTAPLPHKWGMHYFPEEFNEHIEQKYCRCGQCEALVRRQQLAGQPQQPAYFEERYLPARIGERYRQMLGAYTQGNGQGKAPAIKKGKAVRR